MKKTRFTEEQMVTILREADQRPVPEVAKKNGVSAQTLYAWRKHFGTLEALSSWRKARRSTPKILGSSPSRTHHAEHQKQPSAST